MISVEISNRRAKSKMEDFDSRAKAYETRIYRTALILAKNRKAACELTDRTFRKARKQFDKQDNASELGRFLVQTVLEEFLSSK